ncbi:hypothetical protein [Pseudoduganella sp. RAF53_2]|uniref:hypothetical protein n=1 Tax=unclassified Pseudoduganella TaxID=2637179 RepID=UPI003F98FB1B
MKTLIIKDLSVKAITEKHEREFARSLSREEMTRLHGGRSVVVTVDGGRTHGTVDDFSLNMEIFKGNIGGPMIN